MLKVKSAARTLRLLELIASRRQGLSFTEIQIGLDMPKSSANSLIKEFIEQKYLFYSETTKRYYKGIEFIKLCTICIESTDLLQELTLLTAQLSAELRQTTHAAILDGQMIVYLAKHEIHDSVSLMHHIGLRIPAHCTAVGKMLLSRYADETLQAMYVGYQFQKLTENSLDDAAQLITQIGLIRDRGYAVEIREASLYAACVALPIYQKNEMIAAFSATFNPYDFENADIQEIIAIMQRHKNEIEHKLVAL